MGFLRSLFLGITGSGIKHPIDFACGFVIILKSLNKLKPVRN